MENSARGNRFFWGGVGTLGALGGDFRGAESGVCLTAIWQKWVLPEIYTRVLLAIVGPVDSVNLWKTIRKGYGLR